MWLRKWCGVVCLVVVGGLTASPSVVSGKTARCAQAEKEVAAARRALSTATRQADKAAAAYQQCVESRGRARCQREQRAMRSALKAKRDAQAAYSYAVEQAKQACQ